ncbi:MAG: phenylalanine--tRNA ligase subunit beta [Thermoanaerobaculia bacterium]
MKFSLDWLCDSWGLETASLNVEFIDRLSTTANEIGLEIGKVESAGPDTVFDADVTPNRPDAMNHRGFARDLAAALELPFDRERFRSRVEEGDSRIESHASVSVEVPERCRRFAVRVVRGVSSRASSEVWARRMAALDLKAIDSVVDATNISLWGLGQPLHAFDLDRIEGGRLIVRLAREGEKLLCLDGIERALHPEDVVVADAQRAVSLAGIIGGLETAIVPGRTRNVLLEAAWWDPVSIRRTARRHGLHTDASHRYERGADPEAIPEGLALAVSLIRETAGGDLVAGTIDAQPVPFVPRRVSLRHSRLLGLSGLPEFPIERAAGILERLGFGVEIRGTTIDAVVPSWRPDVSIEEDLVEEVIRIHGYSRIPSEVSPSEKLSPLYLSEGPGDAAAFREVEELAADQAREAGLFEAMSFPFVAAEGEEALGENFLARAGFRRRALRIVNPLDASRPALRRLILPGLLEAASVNHRSGRRSIPLFEIGRVWDREAAAQADPADIESRHLAAVLAGMASDEFPVRESDLLDLKGKVARILSAVAGVSPEFLPAASASLSAGSALEIRVSDRRVGVLGRLADAARGTLSLPAAVFVAELDLAELTETRRGAMYRDYSRFPAADVDLTIACRPGVSWGEILESVRGARLKGCEEAILLKLFEDPSRPGTRNVTLRLAFRSDDRTLALEEVNRERDRLMEMLNEKFGVRK